MGDPVAPSQKIDWSHDGRMKAVEETFEVLHVFRSHRHHIKGSQGGKNLDRADKILFELCKDKWTPGPSVGQEAYLGCVGDVLGKNPLLRKFYINYKYVTDLMKMIEQKKKGGAEPKRKGINLKEVYGGSRK